MAKDQIYLEGSRDMTAAVLLARNQALHDEVDYLRRQLRAAVTDNKRLREIVLYAKVPTLTDVVELPCGKCDCESECMLR